MLHYKGKTAFWALFLLGAVFVAVGLVRAEQETVLQKAVKICLECIGLG